MVANAIMWFYALGVTGVYLFLAEKWITRIASSKAQFWKRAFIALPIIFFLIANIDGIMSLNAYMRTHPDAVYARYSENQEWSADRFFYFGLVALCVLPFLFSRRWKQMFQIALMLWGITIGWMVVVYAPLLLFCRVPLQN